MRNALALLTPEGLEGVVATVIDNNPGMDESTAERIVAERSSSCIPQRSSAQRVLPPPRWSTRGHALILHTELYAKLCEALGCFVHHHPERPDPGRFDQHALTRTVATIEQAGYETDPELWTGPARSLVSVAARCNHTPCGPIRPGNCATHGGGDD